MHERFTFHLHGEGDYCSALWFLPSKGGFKLKQRQSCMYTSKASIFAYSFGGEKMTHICLITMMEDHLEREFKALLVENWASSFKGLISSYIGRKSNFSFESVKDVGNVISFPCPKATGTCGKDSYYVQRSSKQYEPQLSSQAYDHLRHIDSTLCLVFWTWPCC